MNRRRLPRPVAALIRAVGLLLVTASIGLVALTGLLLLDGYRPVVITTGSMGDTAPPSSVVIAAPRSGGEVGVGDIVVMRRPGRAPVTHRVVEIEPGPNGQRLAITKGDANETPDTEPYRLEGDQLVSRWIIPTGGGLLARLGDPVSALAVILGAVSLVTVIALRWIWAAPGTVAAPTDRSDRRGALRARLAIGVAAVFGVMFGGVAWSIFASTDSIADNEFGTSDCFDAQVAAVQRGTVTNTAEGVQTVAVSAVDPARSVLYTSVRTAGTEPADTMVMATLAGPTTIELTRRTDAGAPPAVELAWTLVEYGCGVSVQRGVTAGNGTGVLDLTVAPVEVASSFVITSSVTDRADASLDTDDDHLAVVVDPTTVRLRAASGATLPADHSYAWQLVTYLDPGDVSVQTDQATLSATNTVTVTLAQPVDPATTLVLAHAASAGVGVSTGERQVRAHLASPTTVQLTRQAAGAPLEVTLQVITFTDGTTVQHGVVNLGAGTAAADVPLDPVDLQRAAAFSTVSTPGSLSGGATTAGATDAVGTSAATFTFADAATVTVTRTATTADASFGWQVVEWGGPRWWDPDSPFRQRIDVTTTTSAAPGGYSVPVTIDHATMVTDGFSLPSGDDLRVLRWDGATWTELHRVLDETSAWDGATTTFWFRTTDPIDPDAVSSYWLYFGDPAPDPPLEDPEQVWLLDETFESGTLGDFEDRTGGTGWYTADPWTHRIPLTVDSAQIDQDLVDFPLLVQLTDAALGAGAQPDGSDLRFALPDGTPLAHEIEAWDAGTGALTAWVRLPVVSATADTTFHLYYGAANAPDQQRVTDVWLDAESVWHLQRDPAGDAPQVDDSSAQRRDGLSAGAMNAADLVAGVADRAVDFDGADDLLAVEPFALATDGLTLSAWVRLDSAAADSVIVAQAASGAARRYELGVTASGALRFRLDLDGATEELVASSVPTGAWHHVAGTWDGATMRLWLDGALVGFAAAPGSLESSATMPVGLGNVATGDRGLDGRLDEVRIESVTRPQAWLAATVANQVPGSSLVGAGPHEAGSWFTQGTWAYRSPVGVNVDPVAGSLADFALLVAFTSPDLVGATQLDGDDLVFTADDGTTRLDHQLEAFDAGTGAVSAWVLVPSLDTDTELFVYYGNPTASDQQDPEAVFGPSSDLVVHGS